VSDSVSRWLDWTEANQTIYLGTIAPGEDIADPDVRLVVADWCAARSYSSRPSTPTSPRTPPVCATHWCAGPV
jgi:hypothetical protein